jgi:RNA polymerase sigma-70 factor (ECF subfamily)
MDTRVSLLQRLRTQDDGRSWKELDDLYRPFIRGFCLRRDPTLRDEADDLAQEVLTVVIRKLATFEWQQVGSFRAWLRAITWNVLKAHWDARQRRPHLLQGGSALAQLEDPHSELSRLWDQEHNQHVAQRLLERVAPDFEPATLRAFRRVVLDGLSPNATAAELGMSENAVLLAKSRVLKRLREEGEELLG